MTQTQAIQLIRQIRFRWIGKQLIVAIGFALGMSIFCYALLWRYSGVSMNLQILLSSLIFILMAGAWIINRPFWKMEEKQVLQYLDRNYPELEQSSTLLLKKNDQLNLLEKLQLNRLLSQLEPIKSKAQIPQVLQPTALFLFVTILMGGLISAAPNYTPKPSAENIIPLYLETGDSLIQDQKSTLIPLELKSLSVKVTPPAYTKLSTQIVNTGALNIVEGSQVEWAAQLNKPIQKANILLNNQEVRSMKKLGEQGFRFSKSFTESAFYALKFTDEEAQRLTTDFYNIEVIKDQKPTIKIIQPKQYTELNWEDSLKLFIEATIKDDYALGETYIHATISRGEGESVKFEEKQFQFTELQKLSAKEWKGKKQLPFSELGIGPGDELYFYIAAIDTKTPRANIEKSDVYFVEIMDTVEMKESDFGGMAIRGMPEYFRSQRQIINDTEKLITERSQMSQTAFKNECQALAEDQKILRLRYGKFLGEEFERTGGGGHANHTGHDHSDHAGYDHSDHTDHDHSDHTDHDHSDHAGHDHSDHAGHDHSDHAGHDHSDHAGHDHSDHAGHDHSDHAGHDHSDHAGHDHSDHAGHDHSDHAGHDHAEQAPSDRNSTMQEAENLMEGYAHNHDMPEAATFFEESIKIQLKAAMAQMWDAELQLRLHQPKAALPYEYEALKHIKKLQQQSRIYVHKVGFEPPPILIDKKRYSGELKDIKKYSEQTNKEKKALYPNIHQALLLMNELPKDGKVLTENQQLRLEKAGDELAAIILIEGGLSINSLQYLRNYLEGETIDLEKVAHAFYQVLPIPSPIENSHSKKASELHRLYNQYLYE